ncbi:LysR family transcriptional regulator [Sulfitobacter sp.]|jgi:DNA-binding transcriptional LysR family regulator|uniref:LysR family transcriptional regulator n=1 Tax=Sulfitobacter sp. TaxID=1903071 RepID=UPI0030010AED
MSRLAEIETFIVIARTGSISRAAEQLGIAKSAASRRLSDLEVRLGAQLILRTTRQFSLTEEGQSFLGRAEIALEALDDAERTVRDDVEQLSGPLRVAAPVSYGLSKMQPVFAQFLIDNPDVTLSADFSDRTVDLVQDGFDLAIRIGDLPDSSLVARKITSVRHCAVASPDFWQTHGKPETPEDLQHLPFLRYENLSSRHTLAFHRPDGANGTISPPQRVRASNGDFLAQMAVAGLGFMVEPEFVSETYLQTGELVEVLSDHSFLGLNLYAVFPPGRRPTRRAEAFVDCLTIALRKTVK